MHLGRVVERFAAVLREDESADDANMEHRCRARCDAYVEMPVHLPLKRYALDLTQTGRVAPSERDLRRRCDTEGWPPSYLGTRQGVRLKTAFFEQVFERLPRELAEMVAGVAPFDAELRPALIQKTGDKPFPVPSDWKLRSEMALQIVEACEAEETLAKWLQGQGASFMRDCAWHSDACPLNS